MTKINLIAQVCMYNEVEKDNLDRCLDNLVRYCNHIVIYDDASTDDSVELAESYGAHVIRGEVNNQHKELAHKQLILEKSLELGATHLFWLDCDEVLERWGTEGGLRGLCENWPAGLDAYSFRELNLWRSQTWVRTDTLFCKARFVRLWKVVPDISFHIQKGVHLRLYPQTIEQVQEAPFGIIHYGFHDYKKMLVKIGANEMNWQTMQECALTNWILDERECSCYRLPDEAFPPGCLPPDIWEQPHPRSIKELSTYPEIQDEPPRPFIDFRGRQEWDALHRKAYHGDYEQTLNRNRFNWQWQGYALNPVRRSSLFEFDPAGKVIFDLGCGGGWFMADCLHNGAEKVYGFEIDTELISIARRSFQELGILPERFEFIDISKPLPELPQADLAYCMTLFMHIPHWQGLRYFQWLYEILKPGGEAHLQFHQVDDVTMFNNNRDNISRIRLENELTQTGFTITRRFLAEGEGIKPVWQFYTCVKEN